MERNRVGVTGGMALERHDKLQKPHGKATRGLETSAPEPLDNTAEISFGLFPGGREGALTRVDSLQAFPPAVVLQCGLNLPAFQGHCGLSDGAFDLTCKGIPTG